MQGDRNSSATPTAACIDAETLAAWADGGLTTAEAARVEAHLADCDRCTAMVATFARTIPATPAAESFWKRWHLRWLVPVATAATVASLWVLIPRQRAEPTATLDSAPTAAPQAPAPPPASSVQSTPPVEPKEQEQKKREEARHAPEQFRDESRADADEKRVRQPSLNEAITVAPTPPAGETDRAANAPIGDAQLPRAAAQSAGAAAPPPAAAAPSPAAPEAATERSQVFGAARRAFTPIVEVISPDPNVRWRVVGIGQVERSTNGGTQWERATMPDSATLTAGTSPSPMICWLVGRTGAIYVTTDGLRFMHVPFAERIDFLRIEAIDARRATVVTTDGRTMRTEDQGANWTRISP